MRNLKKVLSLALVFAMVFALAVSANAVYTDQDKVNASAYHSAIDLLGALQIVGGRASGSFDPKGNVNRVEMAKMIYVAKTGDNDNGDLYAGAPNRFTDMNTPNVSWGTNYVKWAYGTGIVAGVNAASTLFAPTRNVKGVEAAKMILVAMGYDAQKQGYVGSEWAFNIARDAQAAKLLTELPVACMGRPLTREEAAQMIFNGLRAGTVTYTNDTPTLDTAANKTLINSFGVKSVTAVLTQTAEKGIDGPAGYVDATKAQEKASFDKIKNSTIKTLTQGGVAGTDTVTGVPVKAGVSIDASLLGQAVAVYFKEGGGTSGDLDNAADVVYSVAPTGESIVADKLPEVVAGKYTNETTGAKLVWNGSVTTSKNAVPSSLAASYNGTNLATAVNNDGVSVKYVYHEVDTDSDGKANQFIVDYAFATEKYYTKVTLTENTVKDANDKNTITGVTIAAVGSSNLADVNTPVDISKVAGADKLEVGAAGNKAIVSVDWSVADAPVYSVALPEKIEGYVSGKKTVDGVDTYTIGGKGYAKSNIKGVQTSWSTMLDPQAATKPTIYVYSLYNGKIIDAVAKDTSVKTTNYMLATDFRDNTAATGFTAAVPAQIKGYLADGTYGTYTISGVVDATGKPKTIGAKNGDVGKAIGWDGDPPAGTLDKVLVVSYKKADDGTLILGPKEDTMADAAAIGATYNKNDTIMKMTTNTAVAEDAVFFIKSDDNSAGKELEFNVYNRGNVPTIEKTAKNENEVSILTVEGKGVVFLISKSLKSDGVAGDQKLMYVIGGWTETDSTGPSYYASVFTGAGVETIKVDHAVKTETGADKELGVWFWAKPVNGVYELLAKDASPKTNNKLATSTQLTTDGQKALAVEGSTLGDITDGYIAIAGDSTYSVGSDLVAKKLTVDTTDISKSKVEDYTPVKGDQNVLVITNKDGTKIVALYKFK